MCAVSGLLDPEIDPGSQDRLKRMGNVMKHRGPDGEGLFHDGPCFLGHRLLRIFRKSTKPGPYLSEDGRWALSFNGEIYNYDELAKKMASRRGRPLQGETDAEILLEGWSEEGEAFLKHLNGCFAFALWDKREQKLYLGRDRLGEKPLYYTFAHGKFFFASEIKALGAAGIPFKLNAGMLPDFLSYRYTPGNETLFAGVSKLAPAHIMEIGRDLRPHFRRYWNPYAKRGNPSSAEELADLLGSSVALRIPSGHKPSLFLSSGIDSTALASYLPGAHALTFCAAGAPSESIHAEAIASRFGLTHEKVAPEHDHGQALRDAIWATEEPIGDSILLPSLALARAAASRTRVVFSGEGADELFAGYVHHFTLSHLLALQRRTPNMIYGATGGLLKYFGCKAGIEGAARIGSTMASLAAGSGMGSGLSTLFPPTKESARAAAEREVTDLSSLMHLDLETWLPDYTLLRMDKLLMSQGVEGRLPYLDHRLAELSLRQPSETFIRGRHRKWALRRALQPRLGSGLAWRKKIPFRYALPKEPAGSFVQELVERGWVSDEALRLNGAGFVERKKLFALRALHVWADLFQIH